MQYFATGKLQKSRLSRQPLREGSIGQTAALYCRGDGRPDRARQERDLRAFAKKAGYKIVGVWKETASGAKDDRVERKEVLALAQARQSRCDSRDRTYSVGSLDAGSLPHAAGPAGVGSFSGRSDRVAVRSAQCPGKIDRLADGSLGGIRERFTSRAGPIRYRRSAEAWGRVRSASRSSRQGRPFRAQSAEARQRRTVIPRNQPSAWAQRTPSSIS
jgi:hypothetical protein